MSTTTAVTTCLARCGREVGPHHAYCVRCKVEVVDAALDLRLDAEVFVAVDPDALTVATEVVRLAAENKRTEWEHLPSIAQPTPSTPKRTTDWLDQWFGEDES